MAIIFQNLSHIYSPDMPYAFKALDDINLEFAMHKMTAIIGHTGSGKSTLVQHLNALLLPSEGSLEVLDHKIVANEKQKGLKALRSKVGLVFQFSEYQLFEETIIKDVAFGPKNFGANEDEAIVKAQKALELVGLDESYYDRSPLELSGGQKRRVAIAGILAMDPEVIVLDEPTAGLDPKGSKEMMALFKKLNHEYHKTILLVTHDNEIAYHDCDNVVLMEHSKVIYSGDSKLFFENDENLKQYDLLPPMDVAFIKQLKALGFKLSSYDIDECVKQVSKVVKHHE